MTDPLTQIRRARELIDRFSETTNDQTPALMHRIAAHVAAAERALEQKETAR